MRNLIHKTRTPQNQATNGFHGYLKIVKNRTGHDEAAPAIVRKDPRALEAPPLLPMPVAFPAARLLAPLAPTKIKISVTKAAMKSSRDVPQELQKPRVPQLLIPLHRAQLANPVPTWMTPAISKTTVIVHPATAELDRPLDTRHHISRFPNSDA